MTTRSPYLLSHLDSAALVARLQRLVGQEQRLTAEVLAHLAEVDARKLYREAACSSMFMYAVEILRYSEPAAFKRIRAARAALAFPLIFELVASGELHLSAVVLLAPHLTEENHGELLRACAHRSKRAVEEIVAARFPQPDVAAQVRELPAPRAGPAARGLPLLQAAAAAAAATPPSAVTAVVPGTAPATAAVSTSTSEVTPGPPAMPLSPARPVTVPPTARLPASRPPAVTPLAPARYKVQFTASQELRGSRMPVPTHAGRWRWAGASAFEAPLSVRRLGCCLKAASLSARGTCMGPQADLPMGGFGLR